MNSSRKFTLNEFSVSVKVVLIPTLVAKVHEYLKLDAQIKVDIFTYNAQLLVIAIGPLHRVVQ